MIPVNYFFIVFNKLNMGEIINNIPRHWGRTKVSDVGKLLRGVNYKKDEASSEAKHDYLPVLRGNNINGELNFNDLVYVQKKNISQEQFIKSGDIVFAMSSGSKHLVGKSAKAKLDFNGSFGAFCGVFRPNEDFNKDFVAYFFQSPYYKKVISEISKGTNINNLKREHILDLDFPIPPLPEQQAIVSKIEALLSELENGKQQLQTAQQQLKVYRQSLLKAAFEGKLTNKNVKEGELPKGWKWVRMGDVCNKIQDGSHFSPQVQYDEPGENRYKYITAKNIRNNYMDFRKIVYVDKEYHDSIYPRCNPEFGDVLLTKDGINTGEVTLNTLHEPFSLLSSVCVFKTKKEELVSSFLKYFIQSPFGNKAILDSMTGTAIKRIVLRKIKDAQIILPPLPEQHLIVSELESKLTVCDKIEETISQSLQQAETLRQSILKKAFEGRLITTEKLTVLNELH